MKRLNSQEIAVSGVATALAIIAVVVQAYLPTLRIAVNVIAAMAVCMPLCVKSLKGSIFTYIISSAVGLAVSTINALPFVLFFGLYTIVIYLLDYVFYVKSKLIKPIKILIIILIKWAFYALVFFAIYKLTGLVIADMELFGWEWTWWLLALIGFIAFSVYDPLFRYVFEGEKALYNRVIRSKNASNNKVKNNQNKSSKNIENTAEKDVKNKENVENITDKNITETKSENDNNNIKIDEDIFS